MWPMDYIFCPRCFGGEGIGNRKVECDLCDSCGYFWCKEISWVQNGGGRVGWKAVMMPMRKPDAAEAVSYFNESDRFSSVSFNDGARDVIVERAWTLG